MTNPMKFKIILNIVVNWI